MPISPEFAAEIRKEIDRIDEQCLQLQSQREGLLSLLGDNEEPDSHDRPVGESGPSNTGRPKGPFIGKSFRAQAGFHIECVLREERPMHRSEILAAVEARGLKVHSYKGKKPVNVLASHLSDNEKFVSVGNGYWTLADSPEMPVTDPEEAADE